jgi:hypothetical protein
MLVAWLTLMLFVPCAFAKTDSGTRLTTRLPADAIGRRTPQLIAMRIEAQGPSSYQPIDLKTSTTQRANREQSIRGNVDISQLSQQSDANGRRSGEACRTALRGGNVDTKGR